MALVESLPGSYREPLLVADQFAFHLTDEGDRAAEAEHAKSQKVLHQIANRHVAGCVVGFHLGPPGTSHRRQCNA